MNALEKAQSLFDSIEKEKMDQKNKLIEEKKRERTETVIKAKLDSLKSGSLRNLPLESVLISLLEKINSETGIRMGYRAYELDRAISELSPKDFSPYMEIKNICMERLRYGLHLKEREELFESSKKNYSETFRKESWKFEEISPSDIPGYVDEIRRERRNRETKPLRYPVSDILKYVEKNPETITSKITEYSEGTKKGTNNYVLLEFMQTMKDSALMKQHSEQKFAAPSLSYSQIRLIEKRMNELFGDNKEMKSVTEKMLELPKARYSIEYNSEKTIRAESVSKILAMREEMSKRFRLGQNLETRER